MTARIALPVSFLFCFVFHFDVQSVYFWGSGARATRPRRPLLDRKAVIHFLSIFFLRRKNDLKKVSLYPLRVSSFKFRAYFHWSGFFFHCISSLTFCLSWLNLKNLIKTPNHHFLSNICHCIFRHPFNTQNVILKTFFTAKPTCYILPEPILFNCLIEKIK